MPGNRILKDKEAVLFYEIEIGILLMVLALLLSQGEWRASLVILLFILGFLLFGPPISATVKNEEYIIFKGPIRRTKVTPNSLSHVKGAGVHDYRAHIVLRNKRGFPIMYRCRQYLGAPELAQDVLKLIENSPNAKVTDDALKLLRRVAQGKTKPLPQ